VRDLKQLLTGQGVQNAAALRRLQCHDDPGAIDNVSIASGQVGAPSKNSAAYGAHFA